MNIKSLLFDDCVKNVLSEIWSAVPFLNHDALPHNLDHLEGVLHVHATQEEDIPYIMREDGSVVYLTFDNSKTDFLEFKDKQVILIGMWTETDDVFNVHDIKAEEL